MRKKPLKTKEEKLAYQKQYRLDNKEKIKEKDAKWYQNNQDHCKEYGKKYKKQRSLDNPNYSKEKK